MFGLINEIHYCSFEILLFTFESALTNSMTSEAVAYCFTVVFSLSMMVASSDFVEVVTVCFLETIV